MAYKSIDEVQNYFAKNIFSRTNDAKKASGRALGTFVELITYYLLKTWKFNNNMSIETKLPEYGHPDLTHNVEFTLHQVLEQQECNINADSGLSTSNVIKDLGLFNNTDFRKATSQKIVNIKENVIKNCAVLGSDNDCCYIVQADMTTGRYVCSKLKNQAYAMFECKRVGKEGTSKGPQTIEKAKQGAYVAIKVSGLQRITTGNGGIYGFIEGKTVKDYYKCIDDIVSGKLLLPSFVLTVGVVSNHGNWFTEENQNKELRVLSNSYDWLLFLTDDGLTTFIQDMLEFPACREAFEYSYSSSDDGKKNSNIFTKSTISIEADKVLTQYFCENIKNIEKWFNILTPRYKSLEELKKQLTMLGKRDDRRKN